MRGYSLFHVGLVVLFLGPIPLFAQSALDYSYVDIDHGIDSTIEIEGGSFDSDDGFAITGSWQFGERWYALGRHATNGYNLTGRDKFDLEFTTLALGYRYPIRTDDTPIDLILQVSYELQRTVIETTLADTTLSNDGRGIRGGVRARVTPSLDVGVFPFFIHFPSSEGHIEGLQFELTGALALTDHLGLTFSYTTGEIDYVFLPGFASPVEVEVDRDDVRLGIRYRF